MATTHIPVPSLGRPPRRTSNHGGALVAGLVLALLLGAGLLLWQATRGDEATRTDRQPVAVPTAPTAPAVTRTVQPGPTYYLVGSPAQADSIKQGIAEAAVIRAQLGEAVLTEEVLLVASAADEVVLQQLAEQDAIRDGLGLPPIRFVDLRASAARTPSLDPAASSDQELYQRWLAAQAASGPEPVSHPDGAGVTVPATGAVETLGGLAELIRDGGTPAALGLPASAATSGDLPYDMPHLTP